MTSINLIRNWILDSCMFLFWLNPVPFSSLDLYNILRAIQIHTYTNTSYVVPTEHNIHTHALLATYFPLNHETRWRQNCSCRIERQLRRNGAKRSVYIRTRLRYDVKAYAYTYIVPAARISLASYRVPHRPLLFERIQFISLANASLTAQ